jgi:hypothetical protein
MITATLEGIPEALAALGESVDARLDAALEQISRLTAEEAQANHPFQNRSGDLESSIRPLDSFGSALAGTLTGGVVAEESYASFVEAAGFEFLEPAFERVEATAERELDDALDSAARAARW